jgi:hypothetical protein
MRKIRLRPYRSPSPPASRMSEARLRVYPVTVHCSDAKLAPRSRPMSGSVTFTTVASIPAMLELRTVATRIHRPRAERSGTPAGLGAVTSDVVTPRVLCVLVARS